jgi:Tfp pilus assembly protein PilV
MVIIISVPKQKLTKLIRGIATAKIIVTTMLMKKCNRFSNSGFTIAEAVIATAVVMLGMAAAMVLNTAHLRLVKSSRQSNAATLSLQERVEQMRIGNWLNITDPAYLSNTVLASAPKSAAPLDRFSETITVSAFPDETASQKLIVKRHADGTRATLVSGAGLSSQRLAKVELQTDWYGSDGRVRTRAVDTVISNGGISLMNLPAFTGVWSAFDNSSISTPTTPTTPTGTGDTTGNGNGNNGNAGGNGNGRGNVKGVTGQG